MALKLGDFIGFNESLEHEFKEFVLRHDSAILSEVEKVSAIVKSGILPTDFNKTVYSNIYNYFQLYLPKYISAFANCEELEEGFLYIGVDDVGEITGIPFLGEINKETIHDFLTSIRTWLALDNKQDEGIINEIFSEIQVDVIELETDFDYLIDDAEIELTERRLRYEKYCEEYALYKEAHSKWIEELTSFTNKISYIILDKTIRTEIAAYIRIHAPHRIECAELLESDKPIEILNGLQLNDYKKTDDNVYYWIMFYKDKTTQAIRLKRPPKPVHVYGDFDQIHLDYFRMLTKLRYRFLTNNPECKYYMVKIRIPARKGCSVYYRHPVYDWKWMLKIRANGLQGPCCI